EQATAAIMNERITAGPAFSAAAIPVREKSPAPIIAPTPRETRPVLESVRFKVCSPLSFASWIICGIDFLYSIILFYRDGAVLFCRFKFAVRIEDISPYIFWRCRFDKFKRRSKLFSKKCHFSICKWHEGTNSLCAK